MKIEIEITAKVLERILKDAAENAEVRYLENDHAEVNKDSILSLKKKYKCIGT